MTACVEASLQLVLRLLDLGSEVSLSTAALASAAVADVSFASAMVNVEGRRHSFMRERYKGRAAEEEQRN
jgi:hypothetical protein